MIAVAFAVAAACESTVGPGADRSGACARTPATAGALGIVGCGRITDRYTAELFVRGTTAYTTTWGRRDLARGNAIFIWDVSGDAPRLVDSVIVVSGATTLGDVAVSDDGRWLVVAAEPGPLSLIVYDLADPRRPVELVRHSTGSGGHTAEIAAIDGRLHVFLAVYRSLSVVARLSVLDLGTPSQPREVYALPFTTTFLHDTFHRDGIVFLSIWDEGLRILDVGGGGKGGTLTSPVPLGQILTVGGNVHNAWWFHDSQSGAKRYVFVGQEETTGLGIPIGSGGDIHVVDVTNMAAPREVAFYRVAGAGTHNFSVDEQRGILYAAYNNGGVRALDVRGDLGACTAAQKSADGRCDLARMGRELAANLDADLGVPGLDKPYVWGVHYESGYVYASDMVNGLWKLRAVTR